MEREQFYHEACLRAMQGLLAASGHYRDELIKNPCEYVAMSARHYATELTEQVFQPGHVWEREELPQKVYYDRVDPPYDGGPDGGPDVSPENYFADPDNWDLP